MTSIDKIIKPKIFDLMKTIELFDEIVLFDKTSISPQSVSKPLINQEEKMIVSFIMNIIQRFSRRC